MANSRFFTRYQTALDRRLFRLERKYRARIYKELQRQRDELIETGTFTSRFEPIFREVYTKAKKANPELPDNIKMFISDSKEPNAFATGRKTICVTKGLLNYTDEQIKGVLAHEFGHLAHKDTDAIYNVIISSW